MKVMTQQVAALAVLLAVAVSAEAQTLGDVARKEEARRKAIGAPAKVYTNDNLRQAPSPDPVAPATADAAVPPSASGDGASAPSASGTPSPSSPAAGDEATWRQRIATARDNLARSQTFQEALQSRINALSTDFVNRDDPAQRNQIGVERQKAIAELERVKTEIQQYQKAIADTQAEARKAGVPAGWVR